eukprot:1311800-Rhodomonas_salina.1
MGAGRQLRVRAQRKGAERAARGAQPESQRQRTSEHPPSPPSNPPRLFTVARTPPFRPGAPPATSHARLCRWASCPVNVGLRVHVILPPPQSHWQVHSKSRVPPPTKLLSSGCACSEPH